MATKRLLALSIVVLMLFATASCNSNTDPNVSASGSSPQTSVSNGSANGAQPVAIKAAMVSVMRGGGFWGPIEEGWLAACEEFGWEGAYLVPSSESRTEQLELVETAMTQGYNVIALPIADPDLWRDTLGRAREQGVTIIGVTSDAPGLVHGYVGSNYEQQGKEFAQMLASLASADGVDTLNIITFQSELGHVSQTTSRDSFLASLEEIFDGTVNVVAMDASGGNGAIAQDKLNAYYLANPDMNACMPIDGGGMTGTNAFIQEHELEFKFYNISQDGTPPALQLLKDGVITATYALDTYMLGYACADLARKIVNGEPFDYLTATPQTWITRENVDAYAAAMGVELR